MSVIGIDVGTDSCVVAIARRGGVDVLANETSNRSTPCMVGFSGKERRAGESAKSAITSNTKNTVTSLKKLLGKRFASEAITAEMPFATAPIVNVGGEARVAVQYNDEQQMWRVERLMGMMLHHMRQIAETGNEGKPIVDCVISVPPYWSDAERVAMMQSCDIVGLNVLKLMNDSSAAALSYGIYKTDLPEEAQARNVMIFDLGHGDLTVQIVSFSKGKFVVKSIASDLIGTRDLDMLIARHCQTTSPAKHKIDAFESPKSIFRLLTAAEKLRKTLSSIPTSSLAIECFINDVDVAIKVERADLEEWATPWLDKLALTVKRAFELADMTAEDLFACEVIGGGSRIPCVGTALKELVGKEVSRTLNAEEAVARGCALQGAMLSPAFRVRDFSINEVTAYPINIAWSAEGKDDEKVDMETDAAEADVVAPSANGSEIFCRMNVMPCTKMLTLNRTRLAHTHTPFVMYVYIFLCYVCIYIPLLCMYIYSFVVYVYIFLCYVCIYIPLLCMSSRPAAPHTHIPLRAAERTPGLTHTLSRHTQQTHAHTSLRARALLPTACCPLPAT
ncbi:Hsp70 protein-domain-containing protein [Pavlovales sp. CCMP2436]|nr:Hsp70 protein-domain-containing protein [Pavlovales sp. CCMP2436]